MKGCEEAGCVVEVDAPRDLRNLVEATLLLTCAEGTMPKIERLCFAARWVVVELSDVRAGRAFTFNGPHAVYGALDFERMKDMNLLVGWRVDEAIAWLLDESVESTGSDSDEDVERVPAFSSLKRSVALAVANALSCEVNAPGELEKRGFGISAASDRSFLHPEDSVVLIGAGMLLQESAAICASVNVVDMRPRASLQSLLIEAGGARMGPEKIQFHSVEDTESLVARADVVGITGCALENDTLFDIARLPRRAREFVVFGPSAQVPMELFDSLGVTRVVASRIIDAKSLIAGMLANFNNAGPRSATEGYLVTMSTKSVDSGKVR